MKKMALAAGCAALAAHAQATDGARRLRFQQTFEGPLLFMNASF